jgi:hypothetical protein
MDHMRDRGFLHAQLTIAHWYIDRAEVSAADARHRYLAYAREAYDIIMHLLRALNLEIEQRELVRIEIEALRSRIEGSSESSL